MAFWDTPLNAVKSFFGGGNNQKKKKDDQPQSSFNSVSTPKAPNQQNNGILVNQPKPFNTGITALTLPGSKPGTIPGLGTNPNPILGNLKPDPVQVQKTQKQQELDTLTQQNLPSSMKQTQSGEGWFDKGVNFFTKNDEKIAQQNARTRASSQYQEKHGWNKDPEVMQFNSGTKKMGEETSRHIQSQADTLDNVIKKSSEIPVLSDFTTMGASGANLLTEHGLNPFGSSEQAKKDAHNNWTMATLGMKDEEVARLPKSQQDRLRKLQMGLSVASPVMGALDIASLGEAGAAIGGLKTAGVEGGKQAFKEAGKDIIKSSGKNAIIAGVSAPLIAAPVENYINNGNPLNMHGYDPSNIPRQAATAALWSVLLPGGAKGKDAEGVDVGADARSAVMHDVTEEARLAGESAGEGARTQIEVKQPREIPVTGGDETGIPIDVSKPSTPKGQPIVEVAGDTPGVNQVKLPNADEAAAARFAEQPKARPDTSIEGINNPSRVITKADKSVAQQTIDDLKASGKISDEQHVDLTDQLNKVIAQDEPAPKGQPITVKEVKGIPVEDTTVVPTEAGTPGTVRATTATAPNTAATEAAANAPVVSTPASLPKETQDILDNPKQYNKRQVAAARNQRKLANQVAKASEDTAAALERINSASPAAQTGEGFIPTGEFAKSQNGGAYQKTNRATEMQAAREETANLSPGDVIATARTNQGETGGFNRRDIRNIAALFEDKRIQRGTPEWEQARQILKEDGTIWGQTGALRNYTMRRNASPDELISRFESKIYRLADDPSKIDSKLFDQVDAAETKFTDTRDAAMSAYNKFQENPTNANAKAFHAAQDAADAADKEAKMVEYSIAKKTLKGNKDIKAARDIEKMANEADLYQMDAVDASMLSGTGTFVRNFVNASIGGGEERIFGKLGARIASKLTGQAVGGGKTGAGDFKKAALNVVDASKARAGEAGKNPLEHIKNWATTGNQLGDSVIDSQITSNVRDHYTQVLKEQGFKGRELTDRASVMARVDPEGVSGTYTQAARVAAGLGAGVTRGNKLETNIKNIISDAISGGHPNAVTENTAKLITRMTVGFPTAIGRSTAEGVKRFTLGAPTFIKAMASRDPQERAILIKEAIKQAGTGGAVIPSLFYALGTSGMITGAYPTDQEERDQWKREGKTENSIKIGDNYYQLPGYLGSWALPGMFWANVGSNGGDFKAAAEATAKTIPSLLPTDQMTNVTDVINGRTDFGKFMAQTGASAVRATEPGGALLNQLAKSFDPTQNDTNSGTNLENFVDKVLTGIPGAANTLPNKTDDQGNVMKNPNPVALAFGASSTNQQAGVDHTAELNNQTNGAIKSMSDSGAFADPNLKAIITDDKTKKIYQDILDGKQVSPDNIKKLQDAMVKGVTASEDTAYLEKEQYDTNITALSLKRQLMAADPTTKPSDLEKIDESIKRGEVYKNNEIPYDLIKAYKETSLSDWRAMGDPESDSYDPDMYQQLFAIDDVLTKAGVSYNKGKPEKNKFSAKQSGGGKGSRGGYSSDFGTLKAGYGAPTVQQYDTLDARSGSIPVINVVRPNIVHKIGSSG